MPCITYVTKAFRPDSLVIIERANQIINDYLRQGFKLTLRQLYYQFIARDMLPDVVDRRGIQPEERPAGGHEEHAEELQAAR